MRVVLRRRSVLVWVLTILNALLLAGCADQTRGEASAPPQALPVKVKKAALQSVGDYTEYIATLKSRSSAILQPEVEGQITRIFVSSGDRVEAGEPLIEIDPRKQQATVHSQEANRRSKEAALAYNARELERRKLLAKDGVISRQDLEQAQSAYDASKADVDSLEATIREQRVQLRYYTVKAPATGVIGDIPVRVGDRVATTTVLTTLDKRGELEAYISVPSEKSGAIRVGLPIDIIGVDGKASRTSISFVSPRVDPQTQLLLVKANVPNKDDRYRNDQVLHAHVIWSQTPHPTVPVTAVSRIGGEMFAYLAVSDGKQTVARQRVIHVGDIVGNDYIVLDGIQAGDQIITTGVQMLTDGMPVVAQS